MSRFLLILIIIVAAVIGLGFYMQWFHIKSDSSDGQYKLGVTVDKDKIRDDKNAAVDDVKDLGRKSTDTVADAISTDGTVVSISTDKLTMNGTAGSTHSYPLGSDVKVSRDGKACSTSDLKAGMRIRVTSNKTTPNTVTRIEALENNPDFTKRD